MPIRSVYMMTDLEGVAGVDDWDPRHYDYAAEAKGVYERSEVQRLLTGEVNAACKGLFAAAVEETLTTDGHGAGRTILGEELIPGVKIARGKERPSWLVGISPRFDALVQVGMHAMGYTEHACLAHTMSRFVKYRVNGREVGEMEIAAYLAGELGIHIGINETPTTADGITRLIGSTAGWWGAGRDGRVRAGRLTAPEDRSPNMYLQIEDLIALRAARTPNPAAPR